jgi:hypothetical protein
MHSKSTTRSTTLSTAIVLNISLIFSLIFFLVSADAAAQSGGETGYAFLSLPSSAQQTAMGGALVLPLYNEVGMLAHNPALLDSNMNMQAAAGYANFYTAAHNVHAAMALKNKKYGSIAFSLYAMNYGEFEGYDESGTATGNFGASDIAAMAHWAHGFGRYFNVGISAKIILSQLESYTSVALAMDLACRFSSEDGLTNIAFILNNAGAQAKPYYAGSVRPALPLNLSLAAAHKFEAAPFGISAYINNLHRWNLYTAATTDDSGNDVQPSALRSAGRELLCHLGLGVGVYPSEKFYFMAGYNYLRSAELRSTAIRWGSGFSVGAALRLRYASIAYSWAMYHAAGSAHSIDITINISEITNKRSTAIIPQP